MALYEGPVCGTSLQVDLECSPHMYSVYVDVRYAFFIRLRGRRASSTYLSHGFPNSGLFLSLIITHKINTEQRITNVIMTYRLDP